VLIGLAAYELDLAGDWVTVEVRDELDLWVCIAAVAFECGFCVLADPRDDGIGVGAGARYDGDVELSPALDYLEFGDAIQREQRRERC
jgi:hypothetical protein